MQAIILCGGLATRLGDATKTVPITRLKQEADQWVLAVAIIEAKDLTGKECGKVVNLVLNEGKFDYRFPSHISGYPV